MVEGTITSFNGRRGSGIIMLDDSRDQYIFHANPAEYETPISTGARVSFHPERRLSSGLRATQVQVIGSDPPVASPFHPDPVYVDMERRKSSSAAAGGTTGLPRIVEGDEGGMRLRVVKE